VDSFDNIKMNFKILISKDEFCNIAYMDTSQKQERKFSVLQFTQLLQDLSLPEQYSRVVVVRNEPKHKHTHTITHIRMGFNFNSFL
jgi:hypothetical protein